MKKIVVLLVSIHLSLSLYSQGSITGFTIIPTNPTTTDNIKVLVGLSFTSGACNVDNQNYSLVGMDRIVGSAHHCLGMLAFICNTVDTFNLGSLTTGSKVFKLTLNSGQGGRGCSPGFVPDDSDSINFNVVRPVPTNIKSYESQNSFLKISPNPFNNSATVSINDLALSNATFSVFDAQGKLVKSLKNIETQEFMIEKNELSSGLYFFKFYNEKKLIQTGKLIIQ